MAEKSPDCAAEVPAHAVGGLLEHVFRTEFPDALKLPNPDEPEPYRVFDTCFWWFVGVYAVTFSKLRAIPKVRFSLEITG